jgi:hypothetical protein
MIISLLIDGGLADIIIQLRPRHLRVIEWYLLTDGYLLLLLYQWHRYLLCLIKVDTFLYVILVIQLYLSLVLIVLVVIAACRLDNLHYLHVVDVCILYHLLLLRISIECLWLYPSALLLFPALFLCLLIKEFLHQILYFFVALCFPLLRSQLSTSINWWGTWHRLVLG